MASYPGAIKNFLVLEDGVDKVIAAHPNDRAAEITAIETELGTDVAGSAADLKTRLAVSLNADGTSKIVLGAWVDKSSNYGAQQAATDGIIVASFNYNNQDGTGMYIYTDANSNPTTVHGKCVLSGDLAGIFTVTVPVKKGDYWRIVLDGNNTVDAFYWIPLGI